MARRGPGENSVYMNARGRWVGVIHLGYDDHGKRQRHYEYASTRTEVVAALKEAQRRLDRGQRLRDARQRLDAFLDEWLRDVVRPYRSSETYRSYAQFVRNHIAPQLGRTKLDELTPPVLQRWVNHLRATCSAYTIKRAVRVLHVALQQAVDWHLLTYNPASRVHTPPHTPAKREPLTPDEVKRLAEVARGHRFEALVLLFATVGLRHGEGLGLRWCDVEWKTGTAKITQQVQYEAELGQVMKPLKTAASAGVVALPRIVLDALRRRREQQRFEERLAGSLWQNEHDLIFTRGDGHPLSSAVTGRAWTELLKAAEIPHRPPHAGRHTLGTWALRDGIAPLAAAAALRHADPTLVLKLYGNHPADSDQRQVAAMVDRLLDPE